jgi:hypothetical protein
MLNALVVLLALALPSEESPLKGTLCFSKTEPCIETSGSEFEVAAAERSRDFVWTSADGRRAVLDTLPAAASKISVDPKERRVVTLSINGDPSRAWPADSQVKLWRGDDDRWSWIIPASRVAALREIAVPPGGYLLSISAARHLTATREIRGEEAMRLSEVRLRPLPTIAGRLVHIEEEKERGLAGAEIRRDDGSLITLSGENGSFRAELSEPMPDRIFFSAAGFGTEMEFLRNLQAENDLGTIRLSDGATLALTIDRDLATADRTLEVRLYDFASQPMEESVLDRHTLSPGESEVRFGDLAEGRYQVLVDGGSPSEQLYAEIEVTSPTTEKRLEIRPYRLEGTLTFGDEPPHDATVSMSRMLWRLSMITDEHGKFNATLWQREAPGASVQSQAFSMPLFVETPELGSDPTVWNLRIPKRLIEGKVIDAVTREPVDGASMQLDMRFGTITGHGSVKIGADGSYVIPAVQEGTYGLTVKAPGRATVEKSFTIGGSDPGQRFDFVLSEGVLTPIDVVWSSGEPVANAQVLEGVSLDGYNPLRFARTDGAGRIEIRSSPGERRTLYVIPPEGSLAVVEVVAPKNAADAPETVRVVVPRPTGNLRIRMTGHEGQKLGSALLMRYNGIWIPHAIISRIPRQQHGAGEATFALPAGTYELWSVLFDGRTIAQAVAAPPSWAPVRVGVGAGEKVVELKSKTP